MVDHNRRSRLAYAAGAVVFVMFVSLAPLVAQRPQPAPAGPWMNKDLSPDQRADMVVAQMTLDEKISLVHGPGGFQGAGPRSNGGAGMIPGISLLTRQSSCCCMRSAYGGGAHAVVNKSAKAPVLPASA